MKAKKDRRSRRKGPNLQERSEIAAQFFEIGRQGYRLIREGANVDLLREIPAGKSVRELDEALQEQRRVSRPICKVSLTTPLNPALCWLTGWKKRQSSKGSALWRNGLCGMLRVPQIGASLMKNGRLRFGGATSGKNCESKFH